MKSRIVNERKKIKQQKCAVIRNMDVVSYPHFLRRKFLSITETFLIYFNSFPTSKMTKKLSESEVLKMKENISTELF